MKGLQRLHEVFQQLTAYHDGLQLMKRAARFRSQWVGHNLCLFHRFFCTACLQLVFLH